jgi:hypothetical protein
VGHGAVVFWRRKNLFVYEIRTPDHAGPTVVIFSGKFLSYLYSFTVCKGKAVPLQAWSGPEGSRKLRFTDFMTTAQDGGKVVSLTHRPPLPPGNTPGTHFC